MNLNIGKYMKIFDTDKIDIGRRMSIVNPDGSEGETLPEEPIYIDVPCNVSFEEIDNPDVSTVGFKPIIMALKINCDIKVDLKNNDYVTVKKIDGNGNIVATYKGNVGMPASDQNRTFAIMAIKENL